MKKIILSILTVLLVVNVFAQSEDRRRPASFGVSFFMTDFISAAEIKRNGLGNYLRGSLLRSERLNSGIAINYLKGLSNHVDFMGSLGGSFVDYPVPNVAPFAKDNFLLDATANLNLKLLSDKYWVVPYANVGIGASRYKSYYAAVAPIGAGIQLNLLDEIFISLNSQYRLRITENAASHLYHSLTLYSVLGKKK
jgi:OmpA-OmpF porin, OOP family